MDTKKSFSETINHIKHQQKILKSVEVKLLNFEEQIIHADECLFTYEEMRVVFDQLKKTEVLTKHQQNIIAIIQQLVARSK